jgi:4-amino-4-deoxy-L-arabinose transferase-like glycosyltransferase
VLNIAALYFLGRRLFDKNVALVASAFLTVTATQVFFARYPTTEPLTMLLVFTALLAFQVIWDEGAAPWPWGLLGGAALGAALLTRIDLPLVLGLFVLGILVRWWQRRWSHAWTVFAATLALFVLQMAWVVWQINWPYFYNTYTAIGSLLRADSVVIASASLALLLVLGGATVVRPVVLVNRIARLVTHPALRWGLAITVVLLSLYAYFLRPVLEPPREYAVWPETSVGIVLNGENWVRMGWYLTPLGLFLATIGLALILARGALPRMTVVLGVGVLTTLQYVYNILNAHYHIYAMRRYVPIVIPMLLLFAAVGALAFPVLRRRWITYSVRGLCVAGLAAGLLYQARFVLPQQDFKGVLAQVQALDAHLDPDAIVLFAEPAAGIFADTVGTPLRFIAGREVATVRADHPQNAAFLTALMARASTTGQRVQLLATAPLSDSVRENVVILPASVYTVSSELLMNTYAGYPSQIQPVFYAVEIYDVLSPTAADLQADAGEVLVDVGTLDAAYIGRGFYGDEPIPGAPSMRWTAGEAQLHLPTAGAESGQLDVRAMIYRPEGVPAYPVTVTLDGAVLGEFVPTGDWQTYSFPATVTAGTGTTALLTLATEAFVPAEVGAGGDARELGFLLDWVQWRPEPLE